MTRRRNALPLVRNQQPRKPRRDPTKSRAVNRAKAIQKKNILPKSPNPSRPASCHPRRRRDLSLIPTKTGPNRRRERKG